ncbi:MAG: hypothetical protein A2138_09715 [Deltaproteobacteria bacterium RBG_16_71_12]|nr:MAG: hypothetical protein A2138_09715 [Deltaproteobacteria bacterium RBG_16_71_12]
MLRWAIAFSLADLLLRSLMAGLLTTGLPDAAAIGSIALGALAAGSVGCVLGLVASVSRPLAGALLFIALCYDAAAYAHFAEMGTYPAPHSFAYLGEFAGIWPSVRPLIGPLLAGIAASLASHLLALRAMPLARASGARPFYAIAPSLAAVVLTTGMARTGSPAALPPLAALIIDGALPRRYHVLPGEYLSTKDVRAFQSALGHDEPFGGVYADSPLCGRGARAAASVRGERSVVFLVLEGLGKAEIDAEIDGRPVMPYLRSLASRHVRIDGMRAVGVKSCQALPALFSGLPAPTSEHILRRTPLNRLEGFAAILNDDGFETGFLYAGDLAFEQQGLYLEMLRFKHIEGARVDDDFDAAAWGIPDRELLRRARTWIDDRRAAERRYFLAVNSLGTHHPYALPKGAARRFPGDGRVVMARETFALLDDALAEFGEWFLREEAPRGTVLAIVGDHASHLENASRKAAGLAPSFDTPLVLVGLAPDEVERAKAVALRPSSHIDVGATLLGLLGVPVPACNQGLDLLGDAHDLDVRRLEARIVYAVDDDRRHVYLWQGSEELAFDAESGAYELVDPANGALRGGAERSPALSSMQRFVDTLFPLSLVLVRDDRFAPPPARYAAASARSLAGSGRPMIVASHRGSLAGLLPPSLENRLPAVREAAAAGFRWVEVDVSISKDGVLFLHHDSDVELADGRRASTTALPFDEIAALPGKEGLVTLDAFLAEAPAVNLLLEAKPASTAEATLLLARKLARAVLAERGKRDIVVDSFSRIAAQSVRAYSGCEVGLDTPFRRPVSDEAIEAARAAHIDWLYVEQSVVDASLIDRAHAAGLRVMVYTVDDEATLARLRDKPPDGIITNRIAVEREARRLFAAIP